MTAPPTAPPDRGPRRILVAGATTPIGERLVHRLLRDDGVDHILAVGAPRVGEALPFPESDLLTYRQVDLTRQRDLRGLLFGLARTLEVDTIVDFSMHRSTRETGRRAHALNVEATRQMLHLAERHPTLRHFVFRSHGEVYRVAPDKPTIVDEEHPLDLSPHAPQWIRDRVEADLQVCARIGLSSLRITVLRCAEVFAAETGSQLWDYLQSRVCLRPLGYDPMINLLSLEDAARAVHLALQRDARGIYNIPGADTLPLSRAIARWGCRDVPVPGLLVAPLYGLRALTLGADFRYEVNRLRLHYSAVLDGRRARRDLGYEPTHPITWPRPRR
ncbi:MAG: NAD-dependent epimerase/dehydratase family protein [Myxococcota bacterium]